MRAELAPYLPFLDGKACFVGGYSRGGIFAYEAARQLAQRGHPVPAVLLIDTSAYFVGACHGRLPRLVRWHHTLRLRWERYGRQLARRSREIVRLPPWRLPGYFKSWLADRETARLKAHRRVVRLDGHGHAVATYSLPRSDHDVILFKADETSGPPFVENDYGWHRVTAGTVAVEPISGGHWSFRSDNGKYPAKPGILESPHVEQLAIAMNRALHTRAPGGSPPQVASATARS